jgi:hypothetical protein
MTPKGRWSCPAGGLLGCASFSAREGLLAAWFQKRRLQAGDQSAAESIQPTGAQSELAQ